MRTIEQMISVEVHYCVSSLVSTLANASGSIIGDRESMRRGTLVELQTLTGQALELAAPVDGWESAAREAGWSEADDRFPLRRAKLDDEHLEDHPDADDPSYRYADSWQEACELDDIEPYQSEVYEHWIVSDWLADRLAEQGEKVDKDFAGLIVWARQTTGQAIYADAVIERIYAVTHSSEAL